MNRTKERLIAVLLLLVMVFSVACTAAEQPAAAPKTEGESAASAPAPEAAAPAAQADAAPSGTCTVFSKKREWDWDSIEKQFETAYPGIDLIVELTDANTYYDQLKAYLASNDLPDVIQTVPGSVLNLWLEYLAPMDGMEVIEHMQQDVLNEYVVDGSYYGLPLFMELHGVIYNMDYLNAAGIAQVPDTLDAFIAMNEKLIAAGQPTGMCAYSSGGSVVGHMFAPVFSSHDDPVGYMQQIQNGEVDLTADAEWNALFDYLDATLQYGNEDAIITDNTTERNDLYAGGHAWYGHDGSWLTPSIRATNPAIEEKLVLGVYPFTNDASKNKIGRSTQSISVMKTENVENAKIFVDWLLGSDEGCDILVKTCNTVILRNDYEMAAEDIGVLSAQGVSYVNEGRSYGNFRNLPDAIQMNLVAAVGEYLGGATNRAEALSKIQALFESTKG